jgi:hypothetical protein
MNWGFSAQCLASLSTLSLPWMFVCALTLLLLLLLLLLFESLMACMMCAIKSLFGQLL